MAISRSESYSRWCYFHTDTVVLAAWKLREGLFRQAAPARNESETLAGAIVAKRFTARSSYGRLRTCGNRLRPTNTD